LVCGSRVRHPIKNDGLKIGYKKFDVILLNIKWGETKMSKTCPRCDGSGTIECPRCGGSGEFHGVIPVITDEADCMKCGGTGEVTCPNCDGTGEI